MPRGDRRGGRGALRVDVAPPVIRGRRAVPHSEPVLSDERAGIDPPAKVAVVDGVFVRVHLARAFGVVRWAEVGAVHARVRRVLADVVGERLGGTVARALRGVRGDRLDGDRRLTLLDEMHVEGAAHRRDAPVAVSEADLRRRRRRSVRVENRDEPEDPEVLQPRGAFDQRTEVEAVRARGRRRLDRELEPRDLARTDVLRGLDRDAVVARPSRRGRSGAAVTTEGRRRVLSRLGARRTEVRDLAHARAHPTGGAGVVVRDRRGRALAGAECRVTALAVPLSVESRNPGREIRGVRNTGTDAARANRRRRRRAGRRGERARRRTDEQRGENERRCHERREDSGSHSSKVTRWRDEQYHHLV
jgi:hypothetical protein